MSFLRGAVNARRIESGLDEIDHIAFVKTVREAAAKLGIKDDMLKRAVNVGFSGGEKKRYEILQMALLEPRMAILDETDSGLDVDALRIVSEGVNALKTDDIGVLVITHYQRLLDYIIPDHVHILADGRIVKSGDKSLALEVENQAMETSPMPHDIVSFDRLTAEAAMRHSDEDGLVARMKHGVLQISMLSERPIFPRRNRPRQRILSLVNT